MTYSLSKLFFESVVYDKICNDEAKAEKNENIAWHLIKSVGPRPKIGLAMSVTCTCPGLCWEAISLILSGVSGCRWDR